MPISFTPDQYRVCFPVSIINDEVFEPDDENFIAIITTVPEGVVIGEISITTVTIVDDDSE